MNSEHSHRDSADRLLRSARSLRVKIAGINNSKRSIEAIKDAWEERERGDASRCSSLANEVRDLCEAVRGPYDHFESARRQAGEIWGERSWEATKELGDLASTQVACLDSLATHLESPDRVDLTALVYLRDTILCLADAEQDRHALNLNQAVRKVEGYVESRLGSQPHRRP